MTSTYYFPFGQPLKKVEQKDKTPKKAIVLGAYASAVHARWIGADGKQKVTALAVASEPEIFWRGENAAEIIRQIQVPPEMGRLEAPTNKRFNGPSGVVLDELFLKPLGLNRANSWLCDLLPESRVNPAQREAINKQYKPLAAVHGLPEATIPDFVQSLIGSEARTNQILEELEESKADTIILLGDYPIKYFLKKVSNLPYNKLSDFPEYGTPVQGIIRSKDYSIYALCHPRQAGRLGMSNKGWFDKHQQWMINVKPVQ